MHGLLKLPVSPLLLVLSDPSQRHYILAVKISSDKITVKSAIIQPSIFAFSIARVRKTVSGESYISAAVVSKVALAALLCGPRTAFCLRVVLHIISSILSLIWSRYLFLLAYQTGKIAKFANHEGSMCH